MNREQRRSMGKNNGAMKYLESPCSLAEAAQIAKGVAEDVLSDYHRSESHLKVATSLQLEILKEIVVDAGLTTEEDFRERYMQKVNEFNEMQKKIMEDRSRVEEEGKEEAPTMGMSTGDIEIVK